MRAQRFARLGFSRCKSLLGGENIGDSLLLEEYVENGLENIYGVQKQSGGKVETTTWSFLPNGTIREETFSGG